MINPFRDINWSPDRDAIAEFGRALMIGGLVLCAVFGIMLRHGAGAHAIILWRAFAIIALVGLPIRLVPGAWARPLYLIWFFVGACIGTVVGNTVMALFYYGFFTPIAVVMRWRGRDPLQRRPPPGDTMWHPHRSPASPARYYRQY